MARDNDELLHGEPDDTEGRSGRPNGVVVLIVIVVLIALGWKVISGFIGSDKADAATGSDQTTAYNPNRAEQRRREDVETSESVDSTFTVDDRNDESSVVAVEKRVISTNERVDDLRKQLQTNADKTNRTIEKMQNRIDQQLSKITRSIESSSTRSILDERNTVMGDNPTGGGRDVPNQSLPSLGDSDAESQSAGPSKKPRNGETQPPTDDFPYRELGRRGASSGGLFNTSGQAARGPNSAASNRSTPSQPAGPRPPAPPSASSSNDRSQNNQGQPARLDQSADTSSSNASAASKYVSKTVPGESWVHVTDLHGVACPVGNPTGESDREGLMSNVPITLPIRGVFHGPNDTVYDLGSAHVSGTCIGQETRRPSAIVKIERLSYVGPDGEPQFIPINGYLIDRRDNQLGVAGFLDEARGGEIAAAAAAAGLSAAGDVFSESQFDTQLFNGQGGSGATRSIQGGQVGKAVAGKAFGETADRIAQFYEDAANRVVPVIRIKAGLPITMITTAPFKYLAARSNNEVDNVE